MSSATCECRGYGHKPKARQCRREAVLQAGVPKLGVISLSWECYDRLHKAGLAPFPNGDSRAGKKGGSAKRKKRKKATKGI